ncbi:hypothetical protein F8388_022460 [Cannabis sativa]|uniref:Disease resistance N-terminal domain-containing protein n=1 Tax=Cannabis sativa TaxID=3483 RepID=A0A7J6EWJ4_CANSA|nr:hypothetical protein F8388_022460 [Cannabis sativa]
MRKIQLVDENYSKGNIVIVWLDEKDDRVNKVEKHKCSPLSLISIASTSQHSTALIMADLAYIIAGNVLDKLGSLAYEEVSLAWGMKQDLDKLKLITLALQDVLLDAETKQEKNPQLKNWLNHLKDVFHDAVDVLDEFECELLRRQVVKQHASFGRKVCRFFSRSNPLVYRFSVVHRVKEIRQQLDEIIKNMETFHLIKTQLHMEQNSLVLENRVMTHSFVNPSDVIGRDQLCDRSLFQVDPDEDYFEISQEFRVHDLIHNLACSITQNECSIVNSNDDREISDTVRYLRVVINENNLKKLSKLKKLKSIHVKLTGDEKDESLRLLGICGCENLKALPNDLINCTALRSLIIDRCDQLNLASEFIDKDVKLRLDRFLIFELPQTTDLPQWLQQAANTLQKLYIIDCPKLSRLPESKTHLVIRNCPELLSLPDGMEGLTSLTHLKIEDCDALQEACKQEVGPDWHKIAHVPNRISPN